VKRTNPLVLVGLTPFGFAAGFFVDWALVVRGFSAIRVPWSLSITVIVLTAIVIAMGARVRWATQPKPGRRIDATLAVQILTLAKASSVGGALMFGGVAGILTYTLTRPVVSAELVPSAVGGIIASLVLVVGALIAERLCRIPPDDSQGEPA
jgi:hypothetical protein